MTPHDPKDLRISFSTLACPDWTWGQIAESSGANGFDGVEIRMLGGQTDLLDCPEFGEHLLESNRRHLLLHGMKVCGLASSVRFDHLDRAEREEQLAVGKLYIDLARRLGADFVRVFGDVLPPAIEPAARHAVIRNIAGGLDALGEYSDQHGGKVDVLIETHGDFADSSLMLELLVHVREPRVGVLWDTHHPWRLYNEPVATTYSRLKSWIRHTHWKDSVTQIAGESAIPVEAHRIPPPGRMPGHRPANYVPFGTGEFPAVETLQLLVNGGYTGWYSLEWEKTWHPDLAGPEVVLPSFPVTLRGMLSEG